MERDVTGDVAAIVSKAARLKPRERAAFLDDVCGHETQLRAEVESRLSASDQPTVASDSHPTPTALPGQIGGYRILGMLGEGGMGLVYRAQQERPRRSVALKVVKPGIASASLLRRFEHEVEALGRLRHPGIAQIFEAGLTESGGDRHPFFAMELVDGKTLTQHAYDARLGISGRLAMMCKLCEAVQYAHQRGVIHRDLKPGNILVDETGQPRILDFGLARVTGADVQAVTVQTEVGQLVGTLPYMSPEQLRGDPRELDTRSDIYALGVICYELLSGQLPFALEDKSLPEAVRIISENDPQPLSLKNAALGGDLETIVAKALEKDRNRRYQSASELRQDIMRYQRDEPITARPASTMYQLRKFVRRNRALVTGLAAAFVILIVGMFTTTWQAIRATRAEARALELARAESEQRDLANQRAGQLEQVVSFQQSMLGEVDLFAMGGGIVDALRDGVASMLTRRGVDEPQVESALATFDDAVRGVNEVDLARVMLDEHVLSRAVAAIGRDFTDQAVPVVVVVTDGAQVERGVVHDLLDLVDGQVGTGIEDQPDDAVDVRRSHDRTARLYHYYAAGTCGAKPGRPGPACHKRESDRRRPDARCRTAPARADDQPPWTAEFDCIESSVASCTKYGVSSSVGGAVRATTFN